MEKKQINVPIMAEVFDAGNKPEYLFWVGCAGAFDDRYKKVTRAFAKILDYLEINSIIIQITNSRECCDKCSKKILMMLKIY